MKPQIELADILRLHLPDYEQHYELSTVQRKAVRAILNCRTAILGGHVKQCDQCHYREIAYNSCRNRHCPKCQWSAKERWIDARMAELLPVTYFHLVFTLPDTLNALIMGNESLLYGALFSAAWDTLNQLARQEKWLGAQPGMIAVLHTWGQQLAYHPHLHCIVPGGGIHIQSGNWVGSRSNFFIPVRVLSKVFRGKFINKLNDFFSMGMLKFPGQAAPLAQEKAFHTFVKTLYCKDWVIYAKQPFGGPQQVIQYLGRYTHRIAITNQRLLDFDNGFVRFSFKDYKANNAQKQLKLNAVEFIRRFLQHCLPHGFQKIRYYGILATKNRTLKLTNLQQMMAFEPPKPKPQLQKLADLLGKPPGLCPRCGILAPPMSFVENIPPLLPLSNSKSYPLPRAPPFTNKRLNSFP